MKSAKTVTKRNEDDWALAALKVMILTVLCLCVLACIVLCVSLRHFYAVSILPFVALVLYAFGFSNRAALGNLSLVIINVSTMIRYGIYPVTLLLGDYQGLLYADDLEVVLLMLYELIGIFLVVAVCARKLNDSKSQGESSCYLGLVTVALILLMVPEAMVSPSLLKQFSLSSVTVKQVDESTQGFVVSFFSMGIWTLVTFSLASLGELTKRENNVAKGIGLLTAVSIATYYLVSKVISGSNVRRWGIICTGLVEAIILIRVFPSKKKQIVRLATVGIVCGVYVGSLLKFNESNSLSAFFARHASYENLDVYLSGIKSVRNGLLMIEQNAACRTLKSTLTDFFCGMPFVSRFFDASVDGLPALYQAHMGRTDLICPMLVQSVAHFGKIGSPLLSMLFTYLAIEFNRKYKESTNLYEIYVYTEMTFYASLMMELNTMIILGVIWIRLIYLILLKADYRIQFTPND